MAPTGALLRLVGLFLLFLALAVFSNANLLYTDSKSIILLDELSFTRTKRPNISVIYDGLFGGYSLDFDYSQQLVFWSDQSEDVIRSVRLSDKKSFDVISSNPQSPERFAIDWIGRKIYWADTGLNRIEVSNYNGSQRSVLISKDLESLWSIALVPEDGFLFWADCSPPGKIERSSMDGDPSSRVVIIEDRENCLSGLTVDYTEKRLLWFTIPVKNDEAHVPVIESADFFGHQRRTHLCNSARLPSPFRLFMTLHGDIIYWSDNSSRDIHSCNLKTGALSQANLPKYRKKDELPVPHGVKWFSASAQPGNWSRCSENNGNCSHLCLLSSIGPHFISCACPIGMKLLNDSQTCAAHEKLLLIARSSDIRKIALDTPDSTPIVLRKTKHATLVDYDPLEGFLYWADDHPDEKAILKAPIGAADFEKSQVVINSEVGCLEAIVIDPVSRLIYWTECDQARIVVARLDGTARKVLVEEQLEKPRALALSPQFGFMFWSDWGEKPKIERALLDGSERKVIISTKIHWPNGLAIDQTASRLFFGDAMEHTIEWCLFDGTRRTLLHKDKTMYIFGFTLLDEWIYFSDRQKRLIKAINIHDSSQQKDLVDGISNQLPDWMGIKAINFKATENISQQNPCGTLNGGCSHFCFNRPKNNYSCSCPLGYHLSATDQFNCILDDVTYLLLQKHDIQQLTNSSLILHVSGIQSAKSFDFDIKRNTIYWIDSKFRAIFRLVLNKGQPEQIFKLPSDSKPEDCCIDWLSEQLYWIDSANKKIEVIKSDGSYRKVIYQFPDGQKPKSVVVDPVFGQLFVYSVDRHEERWTSRIDRFFLDGAKASKSPLINSARNIHSLTISYDEHRLYWLDDNRNIDSCKYLFNSCSNRKFIQGNSERFSGISVFNNYIYLLDPNQKIIRILNKTKGFDSTSNVSISIPANTSEVIVSHRLAQSGWNCCANRNGGCEQLCFYKPKWKNGVKQYDACDTEEDSSVVCGCKVNYRLDEKNNKKCLGPDLYLLYSHKSTLITRFLFDSKSVDFSETENFFFSSNAIQAISYDPLEEFLYYIDSKASIQRKRLNDTTAKVIIQSEEFYDIVVNPYSRVLFYTCRATGRSSSINATRLIGEPTTIGTIYWNAADYPKLLAMHYRKNILFWTNDQPKFEPRFSSQSYQISRIILNPLPVSEVIIWRSEPITAITVGHDLNYLIFSSASEIFYSDFDGISIKLLYKEESAFNPFSMAVHSKYLFWLTADKHHDGSIDKIALDLNLGRRKQRVYEKIGEITKIISVVPMKKNFANLKCADENGGCSHICSIVEGISGTEAQCACPLNLILIGKNCTEPVTCAADQFRCLDGLRCTDIGRHCDGASERPSETFDLPVSTRTNQNYIWALVFAIFIFILIIFIIICQFKRCQNGPEKLTTSDRRAYYIPDQLHLTQLPEESSLFPASATLVGYHIDGPENLSIVYPSATGNPPPSPATVRSQSIYSTANSRAPVYPLPNRKLGKPRPKKSKFRSDSASISGTGRIGPPPSLCGSDYDYLSPATSVKYEHLFENEHHSSYIPPAPTPRHYFSDPSCPPSPGTERSFCTVQNLVPPHPSPVPEDDY